MMDIQVQTDLVQEILELDTTVQQLARATWPETWQHINLPLGSTRALLAIEGREARTPGRVAEALGVSRATVTGLLDRLEAEGLVTRTIDPHDRRCFILQLTSKGRDLITQIDADHRAQLAQALARMAPADLQALHTGLAALAAAMQTGSVKG